MTFFQNAPIFSRVVFLEMPRASPPCEDFSSDFKAAQKSLYSCAESEISSDRDQKHISGILFPSRFVRKKIFSKILKSQNFDISKKSQKIKNYIFGILAKGRCQKNKPKKFGPPNKNFVIERPKFKIAPIDSKMFLGNIY